MQSLTPREAQVQRFVEAAELFDLDVAEIELTRPAHEFELAQDEPELFDLTRRMEVDHPPPDFGPLRSRPPGSGQLAPDSGQWTAQQEKIAQRAIEAFITEVRTYEPWTGLADIAPEAIEKFVARSLSIAKRARP